MNNCHGCQIRMECKKVRRKGGDRRWNHHEAVREYNRWDKGDDIYHGEQSSPELWSVCQIWSVCLASYYIQIKKSLILIGYFSLGVNFNQPYRQSWSNPLEDSRYYKKYQILLSYFLILKKHWLIDYQVSNQAHAKSWAWSYNPTSKHSSL